MRDAQKFTSFSSPSHRPTALVLQDSHPHRRCHEHTPSHNSGFATWPFLSTSLQRRDSTCIMPWKYSSPSGRKYTSGKPCKPKHQNLAKARERCFRHVLEANPAGDAAFCYRIAPANADLQRKRKVLEKTPARKHPNRPLYSNGCSRHGDAVMRLHGGPTGYGLCLRQQPESAIYGLVVGDFAALAQALRARLAFTS